MPNKLQSRKKIFVLIFLMGGPYYTLIVLWCNIRLAKKSYKWEFFIFMQNFSFRPFLNLGAQITCPQNWCTNLKSALDQPLFIPKFLSQTYTQWDIRIFCLLGEGEVIPKKQRKKPTEVGKYSWEHEGAKYLNLFLYYFWEEILRLLFSLYSITLINPSLLS